MNSERIRAEGFYAEARTCFNRARSLLLLSLPVAAQNSGELRRKYQVSPAVESYQVSPV